MTEERRVVYSDGTAPAEPVTTEPTTAVPQTVVERAPATRTIVNKDPVANAYAASQLIQTIVWSVVVLVLLIVALWALHVYAHLF